MSKEKSWKGFDQLIVSPSVRCRKSLNRSNGPRGQRKSRSIKHDNFLHTRNQDDGWQIDDHSDDDTLGCASNASGTLPSTIRPSMPQSLNPAEITIERRNHSDSEIEHISEDDCHPQYDTTSGSDDSDDCLAISCTKSRMTRLQFLDKNPIKRRRITDDMDVSFAVGTSRAKNRQLPDVVASPPKCFKPVSSLNRTIQTTAETEGLNNSAANRSTRGWKSFDTSFTEQDASWIEELPSSPETDNTNEQGALNIEELPSSAEGNNATNRPSLQNASTSPPPKTFYVTSPEAKRRTRNHPKSSPLGTLEIALNERISRQHIWQHAITSGTVQPDTVVKLDSIERIFGRVMLRFFTTTDETDDCAREQIENVIFMDQGDKQLRSLHAGMEIALEVDERIAPHRVSHNRLVHLGVTKLCPAPFAAK